MCARGLQKQRYARVDSKGSPEKAPAIDVGDSFCEARCTSVAAGVASQLRPTSSASSTDAFLQRIQAELNEEEASFAEESFLSEGER